MEHVIGPNYEDVLVEAAEGSVSSMDYNAVFVVATDAANHMALGYGIHSKTDPRSFPDMARDTEAWFREIAERATNRDPRLQPLIITGQQHCDRCHDASE